VRSAEVAAQDYAAGSADGDGDVHILDTRTFAAPLAAMVLLADCWAKEGLDAPTIIDRVRDLIVRQEIFFVVDTLEYLRRGGRIGAARALLGSLLQVKPILTLDDGQVAPFEQQRTARRALARLRELVLERCPRSDEARLAVMHADAERTARALAAEFEEGLGLPHVPVYELPPAIVVHGGPGVVAASFFTTPS
jgi:DegV family protein with EDD domain